MTLLDRLAAMLGKAFATACVALAVTGLDAGLARAQSCETAGFLPPNANEVGPNATGLVAEDFNRDGRLDLAVASAASSSVSLLLGTGPGTFGAAVAVPVGTAPFAIAAADVNGDSRPDLLVPNRDGDNVSILLGDGRGTFTAAPIVSVGNLPLGIAVADFDRDGDMDFAVGNAGSASVSVRLGAGDGTFNGVEVPGGASPRGVVAGDLNRDGRVDLVVANFTTSTVSVLLGNGSGGFTAPTPFAAVAGAIGVAAGDFDRDGRLDVIVTGLSNGGAAVLRGDGNGALGAPIVNAVTGQPRGVAVADFDHDGRLDAAVSLAAVGAVAVLRGQGDGSLVAATPVTVGDSPHGVVARDLDGDGRADLAVANQGSASVSVALHAPAPPCPRLSFGGAPQAFRLGSLDSILAGGDFNNDGAFDVIGLTPGSLEFLAGDGCGQFANGRSIPLPPLDRRTLEVADLNADGNLDAVATHSQHGVVSVFLGNGSGGFVRTQYGAGQFPQGLVIADLNGNGVPDLAVTNNGSGTLAVYLGNGNGTFGIGPVYAVGSNPEAVVADDFNRDGRMDVAVALRAFFPRRIVILFGNASGGLTVGPSFDIDPYPTGMAVGDFNGDDVPDLVVADFWSPRVVLYPGAGDGTFGAPTSVPLAAPAWHVETADLDGDARPELLVTSFEPYISVVDGDIASAFTVQDHPVATGSTALAALDYDSDGHVDLAVGDYGGAFTLLRGDGQGGFPVPEPIPLSAPPSLLVSEDLDRDGRMDVVVGLGTEAAAMLGDGLGGLGAPIATSLGFAPAAIVLADVTGDTIVDLIATDPAAGAVVVRPGAGNGLFGAASPYATGAGARGIAMADFDRNGWPDLAVSNTAGNNVSILLNDSTGAFVAAGALTGAGNPAGVTTGDFDRDGAMDLALTDRSTDPSGGQVIVWRGNGDGTFTSQAAFPAVPDPDDIQAADLDGDGRLDLSVMCVYSQFPIIRHFIGDGLGGFVEVSPAPGGWTGVGEPQRLVMTDLDLDGRIDRLLADDASNLSVSRGRGDGQFDSNQGFITGRQPRALAVADFDRDGRMDVVVANRGDSSLLLLKSTRCQARRLRMFRQVSSCDLPAVPFAVQPRVAVVDDGGNVVSCASGAVQASLAPPTPGTLLGTSSVAVQAGLADFVDLAMGQPVFGARLEFATVGLPPTRSRSFSQGLEVDIAGPSPVALGSAPAYDAGSGYDYYQWFLDAAALSRAHLVTLTGLALGPHALRVDARKDECLATTTRTVEVVPSPIVTIGDVTTIEGSGGGSPALFELQLSASLGQTVTVPFGTAAGSAAPGEDFVAASGVVTFAPGTTAGDLVVTINGDVRPEQDETFTVDLGLPQYAVLGDAQAQGTIVNDDMPSPQGAHRELAHGSALQESLAAWGAIPDHDWYRLAQAPQSSYEVILDSASGNAGRPSPSLQRTTPDGTVLQESQAIGIDTARSLRWQHTQAVASLDERISVSSAGCGTGCGPDDQYRLRLYDTTLAAPRFNNVGSQLSVLILQNAGFQQVSGAVYFRDAFGTLLHEEPFGLSARASLALTTAGLPGLAGMSGSLTVAHDAPYGVLGGKVVTIEPATGFALDTPLQSHPR
jgi:hypothetical protein